MSSSKSSFLAASSMAPVLLTIYTIGLLLFRIAEIIPLYAHHSRECTSAFLGTFVLHYFIFPSRRGTYLLHIASIITLVYTLDYAHPKPLPVAANGDGQYIGQTVVITGANAGVGYETSRQLAVDYGMDVIMGCRSMSKCNNAAASIDAEIQQSSSYSSSSSGSGSVTPLLIDLADFHSVQKFANNEALSNRRVDVLLNNAGYAPNANEPVNEKYGLDPSFTSMHLSHFLLGELLLQKNPKLKVVNTASGMHHFCALPFAYMPSILLNNILLPMNPGCVDAMYMKEGMYSSTDDAAYIRAKMANVLHSAVLPMRHPEAVSVAVDLAWVGTSILGWMMGLLTPTSLYWIRSATVGVRPVLHAILTPREELLAQLDRKNLEEDSSSGMVMNVFGRPEEAFSYSWWRDNGGENGDLSRERMMEVGEELWEESERIVTGALAN